MKPWIKRLFANLISRPSRKTRKPTKRTLHRAMPRVEALEDRVTPAFVSFDNGELTIEFDTASETVTVANNGTDVTIASTSGVTGVTSVPEADILKITVTDPDNLPDQKLTIEGDSPYTLSQGFSSAGVETIELDQDIVGTLTGDADVVNVLSDAAQIQDGINVAASGATVNVAAGTYVENLNINVSELELIGAKAGISAGAMVEPDGTNPAPVDRGTGESVIQGQILLTAPDLVVDGFTVLFTTQPGALTTALIREDNGSGGDTRIINNILYGGADLSGLFDLSDYVYATNMQTAGTAIITKGTSSPAANATFLISDNYIHQFGRGVLLDGNNSAPQHEISDNFFGRIRGQSVSLSTTLSDGHTIQDNAFYLSSAGIQVSQGENLIQGNTFKDLSGTAIELEGTARNKNNQIENNLIINAARGVRLRGSNSGATGNIVYQNSIDARDALVEVTNANVTIDASGNWWGTNGPDAVLSELAGTESRIDFTPMLFSGTNLKGVGERGFIGDFSELLVHTLGLQLQTGGRINEGISELDPSGGTVYVAAGIYTENVVVPPNTDSVSLLGSNAGISANPDHNQIRGPESVIDGTVTVGFPQGASDIVVDGFTIQSGSSNGVLVRGTGMIVANNIIEGLATFPTSGTASGIRIGDAAPSDPALSFEFLDNSISGYRYGFLLDGSAVSYDDSGVSSVVSGNYITNNERAIQSFGSLHGGTLIHEISGNTIIENDRGIRLAGGQFVIADNVIQDNTLFGIYAGVDSILLTDLSIIGNTITGSGPGFGLILESSVGSSDVFIADMTISGYDNGGSITDVATVTWETTDDDDTVLVDGANSEFSASGAKVVDSISFFGVTTLNVNTLDGEDTVTVSPHATTVITLDGGPPSVPLAPGIEGDTLIYLSDGSPFSFNPGQILTTGKAEINFSDFENLKVSGDLVIQGTGDDDILEIIATDANSGTFQLTTDNVAGPVVDFTNINKLTFNGLAGDDILRIINPAGGVFAPVDGVIYDGGDDTDALEILNGSATTVEHALDSVSSGRVFYDGATDPNITYSNTQSVLDTIDAVNRIFSYTQAAETITLSDNTTAGSSEIDSTLGVPIVFTNPSATMTINTETRGGSGVDTVNLTGLDAGFDADLTIAAGNDDTVNFTGTIDIDSGEGSVTAGSIFFSNGLFQTTADITLTAKSSITTDDATNDIVADNLTMTITDAGGSIGTSTNRLTFDVTTLRFTATGSDAFLHDTAGGLQVNKSEVGNNNTIDLLVTGGNLTSVVDGTRDLGAKFLILDVPDGTIGTSKTDPLEINVANSGSLFATTDGGNIWIADLNGDFPIGEVDAGSGAVTLLASDGSITDANASATNVTGESLLAIAKGSVNLDISVDEVQIQAGTTIDLRTDQDVDVVDELPGAVFSIGLHSTTAGTITLGGDGNVFNLVAVNNGITDASPVVLTADLKLSNGDETIGSLAGSNSGSVVFLEANTLTTGGNNNSTTYEGQITGSGNLVKLGSGTFTLTNINHVFTGTTTIEDGTLELTGTFVGAGGDVILKSGTTLTGGGTIENRRVFIPMTTSSSTISNMNLTNLGGVAVHVAGITSLSGNTITDSDIGVLVTGGPAFVNAFTNNVIEDNITGVRVEAGGRLTIGTGNQILGGTDGLVVSGFASKITGNNLNNTKFAGQSDQFIRLEADFLKGPDILDGGQAQFDLGDGDGFLTGNDMSQAQLTTLESKLFHFPDDNAVGLIVVQTSTAYLDDLGNLIVIGSSGNDNIQINTTNPAAVTVTINGALIKNALGGTTFDLTGLTPDDEEKRVIAFGLSGNDYINAPGAVIAELRGGSGRNRLIGGNNDDVLIGGEDDDTITGGAGDDILVGGLGRDVLDGQTGNDMLISGETLFAYVTYAELRALRDNPVAANLVMIDPDDLSNYDRLTGGSGDDIFYFQDTSGRRDRISDPNNGNNQEFPL